MKYSFPALLIAYMSLFAGINPTQAANIGFGAAPEKYDSLLSKWNTEHMTNTFDDFFKDFIDIESDSTINFAAALPDSVYSERLKMLLSPIQLPYNDIVKKYLVAYTTSKKVMMERVLAKSQYYFPLIEQELARENLPIELRMLPVIESALNPAAVSRAGAAGLWQFMYATGKAYKLEISSFVDQRRDPFTATQAACRYLRDLYKMYNDWTLALAAYNCGPGNVNKALKRAGESASTYWDIYPYLPRETRGYIPSFIAATYAYTFHQHHDINPIQPGLPISTDTISVSKLMHLGQVSSTIGTPIELLRELNPQYKLDIIPAVDKKYSLVLPQSEISNFIDKQKDIESKDSIYLAKYLKVPSISQFKAEVASGATVYRIKSGDTLGGIAKKHGVSITQLLRWNNLRTTSVLRIGQRIEIHK